MTRPAGQHPREWLQRFSTAERVVHATVAVLMFGCLTTAFVLYNGSVSSGIDYRNVVVEIHVYCGYALPLPLLLGLISLAYRTDLRRLNRFHRADWKWLRSRQRHDGTIGVGKFNAGQKINGALSSGAIVVLLMTGIVMYYPALTPLSWRAGATFAHDWFALGLGLLVLGHIAFALRDPESRRGMRTGTVARSWALTEHRSWAEEELEDPFGATGGGDHSDTAEGSTK
ncbi:MAG: cytochrome b/b6 domain-containing protein [Sciscionella sp.]